MAGIIDQFNKFYKEKMLNPRITKSQVCRNQLKQFMLKTSRDNTPQSNTKLPKIKETKFQAFKNERDSLGFLVDVKKNIKSPEISFKFNVQLIDKIQKSNSGDQENSQYQQDQNHNRNNSLLITSQFDSIIMDRDSQNSDSNLNSPFIKIKQRGNSFDYDNRVSDVLNDINLQSYLINCSPPINQRYKMKYKLSKAEQIDKKNSDFSNKKQVISLSPVKQPTKLVKTEQQLFMKIKRHEEQYKNLKQLIQKKTCI